MENLYDIFLQSTGISTDTRTIKGGELFVALRGERFDSNNFVGQALEKGAMHVITTNRDFQGRRDATVVEDTLKTLQELAIYHREHLDIPVVGITGTNGKTTTKELIASVLKQKYKVFFTQGNLNNHIGVPLSVLSIRDEEIAVIEMGASHPGEIRDLVRISQPTAGLITNVGVAHIEGFGSFEGVKKTKGELYDYLKAHNATIFVNSGNEHLIEMLGNYDRVISYGTNAEDNFIDGHITNNGETLSFEWRHGGSDYRGVNASISGSYNLENALAAVALGCYFDLDAQAISAGIEGYKPTNCRSQIIDSRNKILADAYNANPSSMKAALDNFSTFAGDEKVVILGAMRELGNVQDAEHQILMERLKGMKLERVFLIGEEFEKFAKQYPEYIIRRDATEIIEEIKCLSNKTILLKGSNSNKLSSLIEYL